MESGRLLSRGAYTESEAGHVDHSRDGERDETLQLAGMGPEIGIVEGGAVVRGDHLVEGRADPASETEVPATGQIQQPSEAILPGEVRGESSGRVEEPGGLADLGRHISKILLQEEGRSIGGRSRGRQRTVDGQRLQRQDRFEGSFGGQGVVRGFVGARDRGSYGKSSDRLELRPDFPPPRDEISREDRLERRTRQLPDRSGHDA